MRLSAHAPATLALTLAIALGMAGCAPGESPRAESPAVAEGGSPAAGRRAIIATGCGSCHRIPGIPNADSLVGPPLDSWSRRSFIAGTAPNSQANLRRWLEDPQELRPGSAMPDLELTDGEIADITAYLFTLD